MSSFAWLDYSEHERRKMLDVIALFDEKDTRDELGIGVIRDAISDQLFPGTGTVQTRAKYFLLVPWIYRDLERKRTPSRDVAAKARAAELALVDVLLASDDTEGTIGRIARNRLKRLPSNIYWLGLRRWGICLFPGSQDQYHRSLDAYHGADHHMLRADDGEPIDPSALYNWHPKVPGPPTGYPKQLSLSLDSVEAEFLRERVLARTSSSMLAALVDQDSLSLDQDGRPLRTHFPWNHSVVGALPDATRTLLHHAQLFSGIVHGAVLLYNLLLAEALQNDDRIDEYREDLAEWTGAVDRLEADLHKWNIAEFWRIVESEGAKVAAPARVFVEQWIAEVRGLHASVRLIADSPSARTLIANRERALKKAQSRLNNRRALELWGGAAGTRPLTYRWDVAQTFTIDILTGLDRRAHHA